MHDNTRSFGSSLVLALLMIFMACMACTAVASPIHRDVSQVRAVAFDAPAQSVHVQAADVVCVVDEAERQCLLPVADQEIAEMANTDAALTRQRRLITIKEMRASLGRGRQPTAYPLKN